jgi:hypothetical protein
MAQRQAQDAQAIQQLPPDQQAALRYENDMLNTHELIAKAQHGDEVVEAAKAWFLQVAETEPGLVQSIRSSPHPYHALVQQFSLEVQAHQQLMLAQQMQQLMQAGFDPRDVDQWAIQRAQALAQQRQTQAQPQQPVGRAPPRSIVSQPNMGGQSATPIGPGAAFDKLFG